METYLELKERHEKEFSIFPMIFAFSDKQFKEGMGKLGLTVNDTDKIYKNGYGEYYKKTLKNLMHRHSDEFKALIESDQDGTGFILSMFDYELANHEYFITYDITDTLNALGLTVEDINKSKSLLNGLQLAKKRQFEQYD